MPKINFEFEGTNIMHHAVTHPKWITFLTRTDDYGAKVARLLEHHGFTVRVKDAEGVQVSGDKLTILKARHILSQINVTKWEG